jgi:hypothetical protein
MKESVNILRIGKYQFPIVEATFGFVTDDGFGNSGWNFRIVTEPDSTLKDDDILYGRKVSFRAEVDQIPIPNNEDLLGTETFLEKPYDEETGEIYFTLYVFEHGDLNNLTLKFIERNDAYYRMTVTAKVPKGTVTSQEEDLFIETWIERLPEKTLESK